jgi:hypothetical protein
MANRKARVVNSLLGLSENAHLIIFRENSSTTTAKYKQPCPVLNIGTITCPMGIRLLRVNLSVQTITGNSRRFTTNRIAMLFRASTSIINAT